jgi:hypothetical protein
VQLMEIVLHKPAQVVCVRLALLLMDHCVMDWFALLLLNVLLRHAQMDYVLLAITMFKDNTVH